MIIIESDGRKMKISSQVIQSIYNYIQLVRSNTEAGGILIGRENMGNQNIILEYCTQPMQGDIRKRKSYLRKDPGHVEYYKELYDENEGIYAYYGEWHTHPEDDPMYSSIDLNNWKTIASEDPKIMQYHIIAGRKSFAVWEMNKGFISPKALCEVKWDEIDFDESDCKY